MTAETGAAPVEDSGKATLLLRLAGPLQSWGDQQPLRLSRYGRRAQQERSDRHPRGCARAQP